MRNAEEIESFLLDLGLPFQRLSDEPVMWLLNDEESHLQNILAYKTDTILNFRVKLFDLSAETPAALLRHLLVLNAAEMVHGSYGIEENAVVITGALELENIDLNEVQAMLDSFSLAISTHHGELSEMLSGAS